MVAFACVLVGPIAFAIWGEDLNLNVKWIFFYLMHVPVMNIRCMSMLVLYFLMYMPV
jgi:hypothetical protein